MKCRYCGQRLGMFERWRFGEFCSKEHEHEFAADLARLNEQIVEDLQRLPELFQPPQAKPELRKPLPRLEEDAEPAVAGFLNQGDAVAVLPAPPERPVREPAAAKSDWRGLSRSFDDELADADSAHDPSRNRLRIITIRGVAGAGPGLSLMPADHPALAPAGRMKLQRPVLKLGISAEVARAAVVAPNPPATAKTWVDQEDGWRWIAEVKPVALPSLDRVISMFPLRAPWTNWTISTDAKPTSGAATANPPDPNATSFAWRLQSPPLFNGLVDVAFGMLPVGADDARPLRLTQPVARITLREGFRPHLAEVILATGFGDAGCLMLTAARAIRSQSVLLAPPLRPRWRGRLRLPVLRARHRTLGVPKMAAPPVPLRLRRAPAPPPPQWIPLGGRWQS